VLYGYAMSLLSYDRYQREIVRQSGLLSSAIESADLALPVPSCPGWDLGQLVRHLGGAHRWATAIVAARATGPVKSRFGDFPADDAGDDPAALGSWLTQGAGQLAETLREAGPDTSVWTPVPGGSTNFYARRFTHETLIHRADATLALGADFTADTDVALDAIDEWMELGSLPMHFEIHPSMLELLGPGRILHFHATDTAPEASAEWVVDLTGDAIDWRRAHEKAAVAVRAPLTELLLTIYKRRPARRAGTEILGDGQLLDFWLERVSFG
jgi:uncharacterized protein (TIGR03083 family)